MATFQMSRQEPNGSKRKIYDPYERENERLLKLFSDASSGELSSGSEEPEMPSDSESLSSESEQDPYNDCDGDYGSDTNYIPNEDSGSSTTHVSDSEEDSGKVKHFKTPKQPTQRKQVLSVESPVDSPITLKGLGSHVRVSASDESAASIAISSPANMKNSLDAIQSHIDTIKRSKEPTQRKQVLSVESPVTLEGGSVHVSESAECSDNFIAMSSAAITRNRQDEQVPYVDSPITLKDLGIHVRVPASVESADFTAASSPANMENAPDSNQSHTHIINLPSFDSDTSPPRSIDSNTLLQDIDWTDNKNSVSTQNIETTVQIPISHTVYNQEPIITSANHQRPRSPHIIDEEWQTSTAPIPEFEFNDSAVGPQFFVDANTSPIEVFNRFFSDSIIEQLVDRTNKYGAALCNINRPHTRGSRKKTFNPTSIEEIKRFLGLCILQSHVETPNIRKLFTFTDPLYYHPIFTHCMSGRRFEQLLRCLCVYEGNAKGINKVLGFANQMIATFQNLYNPHKQLSLDESLLLFRGRLSFRQYIKTKKAKYGVKFYILTTSDGYILNFRIYQGKNETSDDIDTNTKSKTERLVMNLMQPYLFKGHELYMDNYYNSVALSDRLLNCMTHTTGTLRKDRKDNPKDVVSKVLKKDEHVWMRKGKVYVSAWKDKRIVTMITTQHHPRLVVTRNRFGKQLTKPKEIEVYNKYMSGIDISDQMLSYYSTPKKTVRWYKKVFFHIFDMALWNAYYTFRKHCNDKETMLGFREHVIRYLLGVDNLNCTDLITSKKPTNPRTSGNPRMSLPTSNQDRGQEGTTLQALNHWPEPIPKTENCKRNKAFLKCRLCSKNKIKKETSYRCKGCSSKPPLCPGCFEQWHCQIENID